MPEAPNAPETSEAFIALTNKIREITVSVDKLLAEIVSLQAIAQKAGDQPHLLKDLAEAYHKAARAIIEQSNVANELFTWYRDNKKNDPCFLFSAFFSRNLLTKAEINLALAKTITDNTGDDKVKRLSQIHTIELEISGRMVDLINGTKMRHPEVEEEDIEELLIERKRLQQEVKKDPKNPDLLEVEAENLEKIVSWYQKFEPKARMMLVYDLMAQMNRNYLQKIGQVPEGQTNEQRNKQNMKSQILLGVFTLFGKLCHPGYNSSSQLH